MLIAAFQYSYINAKLRALKSRLLGPADYENLLGVCGYSGLVECLRNTSYGPLLGKVEASFDGLIQMFYQELFDCYHKVINSLSGNRRRLIQHLYQKYELENLKAIVRTICQGKPKKELERVLLPIEETVSFSQQALLQSNSLEEVLIQLRRTCYHSSLRSALYRFEEERDSFPLEMALDLSYYNQLWKIISTLSRREQKIVRSILGVQMDILNITWTFRFKEVYHFSPEEILNYGLMQGCHISPERRKKLAFSVDRKDVVSNLALTPYQTLLANLEDIEACSTQLHSYLLNLARKNWQGVPFHLGTVLDYVFFKEMEVKNLISLTEAKRMNLPRDIVADHLIRCLAEENFGSGD
ncbi:MAG: V-type ATPase subunit [bacterium]|nr:V-type ATPase subunit [bacterium]